MSKDDSSTDAFATAEVQRFAERTAEIINSGALAVMISIGHRTGLFDTMAELPPSTSTTIARRAGLAERYVREWLASMVTGGIVTYDRTSSCYELPVSHAASLTRASAGNLAVYAQHVALLGGAQRLILERFISGQGTSYDDYPEMHEVMEEDSEQTVVAHLFTAIMPLIPELHARLQCGMDVLDAGCARGRALLAMAERYPRSRFTGYDLCADAIAHAAGSAAHLSNTRFEQRDLSSFDAHEQYDLIMTFDAVHDQRDPQDLLCRLHAALRMNGIYLMQDIGGSAQLENNLDFPLATLLYAISCVHCVPISLGQGGRGLGTMWGWETALEMLRNAGFAELEPHVLAHDPMNVWIVCRK